MTPSVLSSSPVMAVFQANLQDSDAATAETVALMCSHIRRAAGDPLVRRTAQHAEASWGAARPSAIAAARFGLGSASIGPGCFWWAKHAVKVLPHSEFKALLAAYPEKRQLLVSPEVVLRAANPAGDCSTFSMLLAAMIEALGVSWELVTVAVEPADPTLYSHVFVRAVLSDGARVTLDGSHGKYPGWEVPRAHQFRRQVWDSDGEPIDDEAPVVSQLHGYERRGLGASCMAWDENGACLQYQADDTAGLTTGPIDLGVLPGGTMTIDAPTGGYVAPSQSSANWAAFATALAKGGMALAEINAIQPGTVVSANGAILRQSAGYAVPVSTQSQTAMGLSNTAMWAAAAVAVLFMFAVMSRKNQ